MARPQQQILLSSQGDEHIDIIASAGLWAVLYQEQPINIRKKLWIVRGETHKYMKTTYPNEAHAHRTAERMNKLFITDKFTVRKIL